MRGLMSWKFAGPLVAYEWYVLLAGARVAGAPDASTVCMGAAPCYSCRSSRSIFLLGAGPSCKCDRLLADNPGRERGTGRLCSDPLGKHNRNLS